MDEPENENQPENHDNHDTPTTNAVAGNNPPATNQDTHINDQQDASTLQKPKRFSDLDLDRKIELWLTAALVFFGACQVVVTFINDWGTSVQVDKIITAADSIKDSADQFKASSWKFSGHAEGIDTAIGNAVGRLGDQAADMRVGLAVTTENFQKEQRPFVWPSVPTTMFKVGEKAVGNAYFINYGRTPALKESGAGAIFFGPTAMQDADKWFKDLDRNPLKAGVGMVAPGVPTDVTKASLYSSPQSEKTVTEEDIAWAKSHDWSIAIVMRIQYFDFAGNKYWSDACFSHFANGDAIPSCPKHNEVH